MGYLVTITRMPIPNDDHQAWSNLRETLAKAAGTEVPRVYLQLIDRLTSKFSCICDLSNDEVDDGVWTDGPLRNNAGPLVTTLGIVPERVEDVLPFLIETSNGLGLTVFDQQTGRIYRPKKAEGEKANRPWWKFWT